MCVCFPFRHNICFSFGILSVHLICSSPSYITNSNAGDSTASGAESAVYNNLFLCCVITFWCEQFHTHFNFFTCYPIFHVIRCYSRAFRVCFLHDIIVVIFSMIFRFIGTVDNFSIFLLNMLTTLRYTINYMAVIKAPSIATCLWKNTQ